MLKKYVKLLIQIVFVFGAYMVLSEYVSDIVLLVGFVSLALLIVGYGYTGRKSYGFNLESLCDAPKYLDNINAKLKNKDETYLLLYRAYGNLYNGDLSTIESDINRVDTTKLSKKERFMYEEIKLKLIYNNKDIEGYRNKLIEITNGEFNKVYANELLVLKTPLYLMNEQYDQVVETMFELIPLQKSRFRVIELEYYLSLAYIELGKENDAIAVLEFVVKRDFKLNYTVKCQELLDKLKEN
jgi:hypothetical protein